MKKDNILYGVCGALALLSGALAVSYVKADKDRSGLQTTVERLTEEQRKSEVVKRISQQMEDIAYEQKTISDRERDKAVLLSDEALRQRNEAERQTDVANSMRKQAENERSRALSAEAVAKQSAEAAELQRQNAESQRNRAEHSKRVTDTLSYVALSRSLGSLSSTRYSSGDKDVASLLAYGAWYFSDRYGGDPYYPAIFNALSLSSANKKEWDFNKGGITDICRHKDGFITVSNYGEVMQWDKNCSGHKMLFQDKRYDFRDAQIDGNMLYALSRNGSVLRLDLTNPQHTYSSDFAKGSFSQMFFLGKEVITFEGDVFHVLRKNDLTEDRTVKAPENVVYMNQYRKRIVFFTDKGNVYFYDSGDKITKELSMGVKDVCSFTATPSGDRLAFGTKSGMVYVMDYPKMKNIRKLRGHRSMVSQVQFVDGYLITASYDRTLKLWDLNSDKLEPITLNTFDSWVRCFNAKGDNYVWTGDASGALTRLNISPDAMAQTIRKGLKRDLTQTEWNYYVGKEIPMVSFKK